jgi:hypothetical protein
MAITIEINRFALKDMSDWQRLLATQEPFELALRALVARAFGDEPPPGSPLLSMLRRSRDGHLEWCRATCGPTGLIQAWVRPFESGGSMALQVVGAAYGRSAQAFRAGLCDLRPGPSPVLCAVATAGSRRWVRRSWVRADPDGHPRRVEVLVKGRALSWVISGSYWLEPGESASEIERLNLFEIVGSGARRTSDAPAGLALAVAGRGAWRRDEETLIMERPVLVRLARRVRIRLLSNGELRQIAACGDYARARYAAER